MYYRIRIYIYRHILIHAQALIHQVNHCEKSWPCIKFEANETKRFMLYWRWRDIVNSHSIHSKWNSWNRFKNRPFFFFICFIDQPAHLLFFFDCCLFFFHEALICCKYSRKLKQMCWLNMLCIFRFILSMNIRWFMNNHKICCSFDGHYIIWYSNATFTHITFWARTLSWHVKHFVWSIFFSLFAQVYPKKAHKLTLIIAHPFNKEGWNFITKLDICRAIFGSK